MLGVRRYRCFLTVQVREKERMLPVGWRIDFLGLKLYTNRTYRAYVRGF